MYFWNLSLKSIITLYSPTGMGPLLSGLRTGESSKVKHSNVPLQYILPTVQYLSLNVRVSLSSILPPLLHRFQLQRCLALQTNSNPVRLAFNKPLPIDYSNSSFTLRASWTHTLLAPISTCLA